MQCTVDGHSPELGYGCQVLDDRKQTSAKWQQNRSPDHTFKQNLYTHTVLCRLSFTSGTPMSRLCHLLKKLGVTLDSDLTCLNIYATRAKPHTYKSGIIISSIRHLLTTQATQTLVCCIVLSRLEYCTSFFSGCLPSVLTRQSSECSRKASA